MPVTMPFVLKERRGNALLITLNRPEVYNAFEEGLLGELWDVLRGAAVIPEVRAVVLTGAGHAFCAGGDLRTLMEAYPDWPGDGFYRMAAVYHQCITEIRQMPKPVVAAINGPAAGGGFSIALACDLRIMSDTAFLQQAYTSSGLCMDGGGTFTLPRLVGLAKALEIAMLDERLDAQTALRLGLVTRVVPDAVLKDEALELAERLARMPMSTLGELKALFNGSFQATLPEQLELERHGLAATANHAEGREGLAAFVERRKPDFLAATQRARRRS